MIKIQKPQKDRDYEWGAGPIKVNQFFMHTNKLNDALKLLESNEDRFYSILFDVKSDKKLPDKRNEIQDWYIVDQSVTICMSLVRYLSYHFRFDNNDSNYRERVSDDPVGNLIQQTKSMLQQYKFEKEHTRFWLKLYELLDTPWLIPIFLPTNFNNAIMPGSLDSLKNDLSEGFVSQLESLNSDFVPILESMSHQDITRLLSPTDHDLEILKKFNMAHNSIKSELLQDTLNEYMINKICAYIVLNKEMLTKN